MQQRLAASCLESGWCDFSEEHARIRREIEEMIKTYVNGGADEYYMPVIVAPYGSGKTALLRHLEWFATRRLGVPAARVEFADIVDFIVERYGSIHEHQLPGILEEYVAEKHGSRDGFFVLLVDEVEESYDVFRGVVEHETSPLRGLAEAVRTRTTRVYPVLALGPSSTLKEAVFGPVAWRSRVFTIPLLPRSALHAELREKLGNLDDRLRELLANMAWWASKGRVAWARLIVDTVAPRLAEALAKGPEAVEAVLLGDEALSREILDGVPLFDRRGYREAKRFLPDRRLAPLLAALPGPLPLGLAERLTGAPIVPEPSPVMGFSRSAVEVEALVDAAIQWMERVARARDVPQHSVDHAAAMLEHVLQALSLGASVPYDQEFLREAFSLAADLAREVYSDDPSAAYLLETLHPDMVAPEPRRLEEPVVYMRPRMLSRIYPVAGSSPLIGCARRAGPGQVVEVVESLSPEELEALEDRMRGLLGLDALQEKHGIRVEIVPAPLLPAAAEKLACRSLEGGLVLVVAEPREDVEPKLPEALRGLAELGLVSVARAGPRLSMFIYSLLYSLGLGLPGCSLDRLAPSESRALHVYTELLRSLVLDAAASRRGAKLRAEIAALEKTLGPSAALLAAAAGKGSAEKLAKVLERLVPLAGELARIAGLEPPRLPGPREVARLGELAQRLPAARLSGCKGSTGSRLLDALLGLEEPPAVDTSLLEEAKALAASVPVGPAARVAELLAGIADEQAGLAAELLAPLLQTLRARLEALARLYSEVERLLVSVPGEPGRRLREALLRDLSRASSLREQEEMLAEALRLAPRIEEVRRAVSALEAVEEERRRLLALFDQVFGAAPASQQRGVEAEHAV